MTTSSSKISVAEHLEILFATTLYYATWQNMVVHPTLATNERHTVQMQRTF